MSQANFMRNIRMTMPQFVTNVTSFGDTVKILKNKGILNEGTRYTDPDSEDFSIAVAEDIEGGNWDLTPEQTQAALDYAEEHGYDLQGDFANTHEVGGGSSKAAKYVVGLIKGKDVSENKDHEEKTDTSDAEFDAILKQLEDEKAGEEEVAAQYDLEEGTLTVKQIVDKFEELLDRNPNTKVDDLAKVLNTTKEELAKINKLSGLEKIKAIYLTSDPFSIENDILTPTMKIKRNVAAKAYAEQIDAMYKSLAETAA